MIRPEIVTTDFWERDHATRDHDRGLDRGAKCEPAAIIVPATIIRVLLFVSPIIRPMTVSHPNIFDFATQLLATYVGCPTSAARFIS